MMVDPDARKSAQVMKAFLQMKKFDIETLKRAYEGETVQPDELKAFPNG